MSGFDFLVFGFQRLNSRRTLLSVADSAGVEFDYQLRHSTKLFEDLSEAATPYTYKGCDHSQSEPRSKHTSDGRELVARQCMRCGQKTSAFLKKADWPKIWLPWRDDLEIALDEPRRQAEIAVLPKIHGRTTASATNSTFNPRNGCRSASSFWSVITTVAKDAGSSG